MQYGYAESFCLWAGVATAFASPIGGLLFTIEEGASFYSTSIFWRGFLSTGIGVLTLHFLVECSVRHPGHDTHYVHIMYRFVAGWFSYA